MGLRNQDNYAASPSGTKWINQRNAADSIFSSVSKRKELPLAFWLDQLQSWLVVTVCQMTNVAKHSAVCSGLRVSGM